MNQNIVIMSRKNEKGYGGMIPSALKKQVLNKRITNTQIRAIFYEYRSKLEIRHIEKYGFTKWSKLFPHLRKIFVFIIEQRPMLGQKNKKYDIVWLGYVI